MFHSAQQKIFVVFAFPVNYGIKAISLCGDNSTEYDYEGSGKFSTYEKIREVVFLFVFIIFCCYSNIDPSTVKWFSRGSYMFFCKK